MTLTPDEIEAERERFEAWIRLAYARNADLATVKGDYANTFTWSHWQGWLAAIASERDRRKHERDAAEAVLAMQGWPEMKHMREKWENGE